MWSLNRQRFHVGLSPDRLTVATAPIIWPGGQSRQDSVPCNALPNAEPWRAPVNALSTFLAKDGGERRSMRVVLSGHFVRWQLLPWRPELTQADELESYAALQLRETFGSVAESWRVLHVPQPPRTAMPVCAVDAALVEELANIAKTSGVHLEAVTPYFASAFDRWHGGLKATTFWFGVIEPDFISLGLVNRGDWVGLSVKRLSGSEGDWHKVLPGMMAQIGITSGSGEAATPLFLAGEGNRPVERLGLEFTWLQAKTRATSAPPGYRLALGV